MLAIQLNHLFRLSMLQYTVSRTLLSVIPEDSHLELSFLALAAPSTSGPTIFI